MSHSHWFWFSFIFLAPFAFQPKSFGTLAWARERSFERSVIELITTATIKITLFQFACDVYKQNIICIKSYAYEWSRSWSQSVAVRANHKTKHPTPKRYQFLENWIGTLEFTFKYSKNNMWKYPKKRLSQKVWAIPLFSHSLSLARSLVRSTHEWIYRYSVFVVFDRHMAKNN